MSKVGLNYLLHSESETVEWKRSFGEWKEIVISAAAMASCRGGQIGRLTNTSGDRCRYHAETMQSNWVFLNKWPSETRPNW